MGFMEMEREAVKPSEFRIAAPAADRQFRRAQVLFELGYYELSLRALEECLRIDPGYRTEWTAFRRSHSGSH